MKNTDKERTSPQDLNIDLSGQHEDEVFKWFLACLLFARPISQEIAAKTFRILDGHGFSTPKQLAEADWQELVDLLGEGGYRRYDESTARELIDFGKRMLELYDGDILRIRDEARDDLDVHKRLQEFTGIGPTAVQIFLRELDW
jgi:3-methyladenine DNA glycosylase/8-oxoguanine DNA glycosylase